MLLLLLSLFALSAAVDFTFSSTFLTTIQKFGPEFNTESILPFGASSIAVSFSNSDIIVLYNATETLNGFSLTPYETIGVAFGPPFIQYYINGPAAQAYFIRPRGMCFHEQRNMLVVADTGNTAIRGILLDTMTVITLAGTNKTGSNPSSTFVAADQPIFQSPISCAVLGESIYILDGLFNAIFELDLLTNRVRLFCGYLASPNTAGSGYVDGSCADALFRVPLSITATPDGSGLFVADSFNKVFRLITFTGASGPTVSTAIGNRSATCQDPQDGYAPSFCFNTPSSLAVFSPEIFVLGDPPTNRIWAMNTTSKFIASISGLDSVVGGDTDGPPKIASLSYPTSVHKYGQGVLFANNRKSLRYLSMNNFFLMAPQESDSHIMGHSASDDPENEGGPLSLLSIILISVSGFVAVSSILIAAITLRSNKRLRLQLIMTIKTLRRSKLTRKTGTTTTTDNNSIALAETPTKCSLVVEAAKPMDIEQPTRTKGDYDELPNESYVGPLPTFAKLRFSDGSGPAISRATSSEATNIEFSDYTASEADKDDEIEFSK